MSLKIESISVFDIFKIGVGPSSSHTLGPWRAGMQFIQKIKIEKNITDVSRLQILLYGSLAKTGVGHGTDIAVQLGIQGFDPVTFDVEQIYPNINNIKATKTININQENTIEFDPATDIVFLMNESLPYHPNALTFCITMKDGSTLAQTYYSIGGGFVETEEPQANADNEVKILPFAIHKGDELLTYCSQTGMSIAQLVYKNEEVWRSKKETDEGVLKIWKTMKDCIYRGAHIEGTLPGGLNVARRAAGLNKKLIDNKNYQNFDEWLDCIKKGGGDFNYILNWVSCFALAVNEENASFSRVVTAPTNGAAGVIPAVLMYFVAFCNGNENQKIINFVLTASEIGSIFKKGATISAAMGGCQAEIGVSSAMAAAALCESLGGSPQQAMMAAEIAMEHHLGLTCDPVGGLVQIPCIERNTMGAIKAITACQLALQSDPQNAKVSLDAVVKTMWHTALDMNHKYKETSDGGLAVNIPLGLSEC